jgi:hypothetical protein
MQLVSPAGEVVVGCEVFQTYPSTAQLVKAHKTKKKFYIDVENKRSLIGTSSGQEPAVWRELHVLDMSRMRFQVDGLKIPQVI